MRDVLGYSGKRVIVTGAASGIGANVARLLVDLGAEVHVVDEKKPDVSGLASFTECDVRDVAQADAAVQKIGKIVNALFNCARVPDAGAVIEAVIPNMIDGAAIVSVGAEPDAYASSRAPKLAEHGIRINCVSVTSRDDDAWPMVFLNSPRASGITGQCLTVRAPRE